MIDLQNRGGLFDVPDLRASVDVHHNSSSPEPALDYACAHCTPLESATLRLAAVDHVLASHIAHVSHTRSTPLLAQLARGQQPQTSKSLLALVADSVNHARLHEHVARVVADLLREWRSANSYADARVELHGPTVHLLAGNPPGQTQLEPNVCGFTIALAGCVSEWNGIICTGFNLKHRRPAISAQLHRSTIILQDLRRPLAQSVECSSPIHFSSLFADMIQS